jgi:hypothetical protein
MKSKTFNIPIYDYKVTLVEIESREDVNNIVEVLKKNGLSKEDINEEISYVSTGKYNGGNVYRNFKKKKFLIILYRMTSVSKRIEVLGHEKRHIEDRLAEHCGINDIEAMGYLAGYSPKKLFI